MSFKNRSILAALAAVTVGAAVLVAYAADNTPANPNQPNSAQPNSAQPNGAQANANQAVPYRVNRLPVGQAQSMPNGRQQDVDLFLIPCLINGNNGEVALGNIAEQRAQSSEVKGFAQQAIKDHTAAAKQFEQLQTTLRQHLRPQNPNNTPVAAALFQINQEVEQTCLANAQRELEQQSGREFDRCYIGMQVGMHEQLVSALSVFKNHATSPEFKKAIEDLSQVASHHLDDAKKIWKDLEQHGESKAAASVNSSR